jgi:hypothetical protein
MMISTSLRSHLPVKFRAVRSWQVTDVSTLQCDDGRGEFSSRDSCRGRQERSQWWRALLSVRPADEQAERCWTLLNIITIVMAIQSVIVGRVETASVLAQRLGFFLSFVYLLLPSFFPSFILYFFFPLCSIYLLSSFNISLLPSFYLCFLSVRLFPTQF